MSTNQFVRRGISSVLVLLLAGPAVPLPAGAAELGRLFFTPQQRQDLEHRRVRGRNAVKAPPPRAGSISVEGQVKRSSGRNAAWINDAPHYDVDIVRPGQARIAPDAGASGVGLKVGQTYERASGKVSDGLEGGRITVRQTARPGDAAPAR